MDELGHRLSHVERECREKGVRVSFARKAKGVNKFGQNLDIDASVQEMVWTTGGFETLPTTNAIDSLSSSSASDTMDVVIIGHTVSGTGEDAVYTEVVQTATVSGQSKVTLATPLARVERAYNDSGTQVVGNITIYEDTAISGGVPTDDTKIHIEVGTAEQSYKAALTVPDGEYLAITTLTLGVKKQQSATVDFVLQVANAGKVFRTRAHATSSRDSGSVQRQFDPPLVVDPNSDVRILATSSAANVEVSVMFDGYYAEVY